MLIPLATDDDQKLHSKVTESVKIIGNVILRVIIHRLAAHLFRQK